MKSRGLSLKLITVLAVTSVLLGVSSCHVNFTVESSNDKIITQLRIEKRDESPVVVQEEQLDQDH